MGDLDGDGVADLAAGAVLDDDGAGGAGAVWVLFLDDGAVPPIDLTASATSPLTVAPGGSVTFSYVVTNGSASPVSGDLYYTARRDGAVVASGVVTSGGADRARGHLRGLVRAAGSGERPGRELRLHAQSSGPSPRLRSIARRSPSP